MFVPEPSPDFGVPGRLEPGECPELVKALQVARCPHGSPAALDEHILQLRVALTSGTAMTLAGRLMVARAQADPGGETGVGRESVGDRHA